MDDTSIHPLAPTATPSLVASTNTAQICSFPLPSFPFILPLLFLTWPYFIMLGLTTLLLHLPLSPCAVSKFSPAFTMAYHHTSTLLLRLLQVETTFIIFLTFTTHQWMFTYMCVRYFFPPSPSLPLHPLCVADTPKCQLCYQRWWRFFRRGEVREQTWVEMPLWMPVSHPLDCPAQKCDSRDGLAECRVEKVKARMAKWNET